MNAIEKLNESINWSEMLRRTYDWLITQSKEFNDFELKYAEGRLAEMTDDNAENANSYLGIKYAEEIASIEAQREMFANLAERMVSYYANRPNGKGVGE